MKMPLLKKMNYGKSRRHEFSVCMKEFAHGSKRIPSAYRGYFENRLMLLSHSIEKGLGLRTTEPGHGSDKVTELLTRMLEYVDAGLDINRFAFRLATRTVMAYVDFQKGYDTSLFPAFEGIEKQYQTLCVQLGGDYLAAVREELEAGARVLTREQLMEGSEFDFGKFISSRHSMRTYEKKAIPEETIKKAISIANLAPSACNRQATDVYFSNTPEIVEKIDDLITGTIGFKGETPNYMIVTTDRARFANEEQLQWYMNGGIYLTHLILAMHSLGIGCCIMQWKAFYKTEAALKELLGISKSEAIIAIVGCGYYRDEVRCICAQRKSADDTLHICK